MAERASAMARRLHLGKGPQIVAVFLFMALLVAMVIEPARQLLAQRDRVAEQSGILSSLERSNGRLRQKIDRLKDPDFIEQRAREQAGLVLPGEVPIVVMPPSDGGGPKRRPERRRPTAVRPEPEAEPGFLEGVLRFVGFM